MRFQESPLGELRRISAIAASFRVDIENNRGYKDVKVASPHQKSFQNFMERPLPIANLVKGRNKEYRWQMFFQRRDHEVEV